MTNYINPLEQQAALESESSDKSLESKSAMVMDDASICPKCKKPMSQATIEGDEPAFWCDKGCRVSSPMPLEE